MPHTETIRNAEVRQHCPHETGGGSGHEWAMARRVICCNCGAEGSKRYELRRQRVQGHGPNYLKPEWTLVDLVWNDEGAGCSG